MAKQHKLIADSMREGDSRYASAIISAEKIDSYRKSLRSVEREARIVKLKADSIRLEIEKLEYALREELEVEFYTLEEGCRVTGLERRKLTNRLIYGRIFGMKILGQWWVEKETADSFIEED